MKENRFFETRLTYLESHLTVLQHSAFKSNKYQQR